MKKNLLAFVFAMFVGVTVFAQTAPDFTATDCNGNSHNLYTELNAGKVIVLVWVMPCGACTGPALTAYNVVQSYGSSNVVYYLIDDAGNTACTSLSSWATGSGIGTNRTTFSTTSIVESNYGGVGMPHVAVVGNSNHNTFFNGLNAAAGDATGIQNAINTALSTSGIATISSHPYQLTVFPSPASQKIKVSYAMKESAQVTLQIFNSVGQSVIKNELGKQSAGDYSSDIDLNKSAAGIYYMRLSAGTNSETVKFTISK
jgi:hypothetical protein